MDQGDGQTHDAQEPQAARDAGTEGVSSEGAGTGAQDDTSQRVGEKPARGRKRSPVRVDASIEGDGATAGRTGEGTEPAAGDSQAASPERAAQPSIADRVEAVILSTDRALSPERIAIALGLIPEDPERADTNDAAPVKPSRGRKRPQSLVEEAIMRVDAAVAELNGMYEQTGRSFRIEGVAGGYRVMTLSRYAPDVARLRNAKVSSKLSRAAIETLAIIAYKQPMTRAELEAIRGVSCGEVLKSLLERRLVTIKGRAEELGRPMLYGTTREFLDHFGLASIKDLPTVEELRASAGA